MSSYYKVTYSDGVSFVLETTRKGKDFLKYLEQLNYENTYIVSAVPITEGSKDGSTSNSESKAAVAPSENSREVPNGYGNRVAHGKFSRNKAAKSDANDLNKGKAAY